VRGNKRSAAAAQRGAAPGAEAAAGDARINLKGFLVGNAWTDPQIDNMGALVGLGWDGLGRTLRRFSGAFELTDHDSVVCFKTGGGFEKKTRRPEGRLTNAARHSAKLIAKHNAPSLQPQCAPGTLDFWYTHALISEEVHAGIHRHCNFR